MISGGQYFGTVAPKGTKTLQLEKKRAENKGVSVNDLSDKPFKRIYSFF